MATDDGVPPPAKRPRSDGSVDLVDKSILQAAQDPEQWIAERRKNWPTRERIATKAAEAERLRLSQHTSGNSANEPMPAPANDVARTQRKPPLCRYFLRGRCNAGAGCRFTHERPNQELRPTRPAHEHVYKRFEPPTKASLFVKLVQTDHDAEDEKLLDFIEYLYKQQRI